MELRLNSSETVMCHPSAFLLQDSRGLVGDKLMFWAKAGSYTSSISDAEVFTEAQAFAQNESRPSDVPWPKEYLVQRARPAVDMQYVRQTDMANESNEQDRLTCNYVYARSRTFEGNDLLFMRAGTSVLTSNLDEAAVFKHDNGVLPQIGADFVAWEKSYLVKRSRLTVLQQDVDLKKALGEKINLVTKEKKLSYRYRCDCCGTFISSIQHYTNDCKRCKAIMPD